MKEMNEKGEGKREMKSKEDKVYREKEKDKKG